MRAVVALADETLQHLVLAGNGLQLGQCIGFGAGRRQLHRAGAGDGLRHDGGDQRLAGRSPHDGEHVGFIGGRDADVAGVEFAGVFQCGQGGGVHDFNEKRHQRSVGVRW